MSYSLIINSKNRIAPTGSPNDATYYFDWAAFQEGKYRVTWSIYRPLLPLFTPSAYGITGLSNTGAFRIYTFTDPSLVYTISYRFFAVTPVYTLIVGGGGAGGIDQGGGGGGGGVIQLTKYVAAGTNTITINVAAATLVTNAANPVRTGNNTSITFGGDAVTYTGYGGGCGAGYASFPSSGASGGGGSSGAGGESHITASTQSAAAAAGGNLGNSGGNAILNNGSGGGGGGGAGGIGVAATGTLGGSGGLGVQCTLPGISTFGAYAGYYWGGEGGAGGAFAMTMSGSGGNGGGGSGASSNNTGTGGAGLNAGTRVPNNVSYGGAGGANTGGGGGGSRQDGNSSGGSGGSGIIIIAIQV